MCALCACECVHLSVSEVLLGGCVLEWVVIAHRWQFSLCDSRLLFALRVLCFVIDARYGGRGYFSAVLECSRRRVVGWFVVDTRCVVRLRVRE